MSDETEAHEEDAEFTRLLEEAAAADPNDLQAQEELGMLLLARAGELSEMRPPTLRDSLQQELETAREQGNWVAAEEACRRLIALSESPMHLYRDWKRLADTLGAQDRNDEAYAAIQTSTRMAREAKIDQLLQMALRTEAEWAVWREDFSQARNCIDEGLKCLAETDVKQDWQPAPLLVQRAWLWLREENLQEALADLNAAEPLVMPYSQSLFFAGPLQALQEWWWATAWLRLYQQNNEGAREAGNEGIWLARRMAELPQLGVYQQHEGLREALEKFAQLHENLGDLEVAEAARREASAIK